MKTRYTILQVSALAMSLFIFGCKKDNVIPNNGGNDNNPKPTYASVSEVFKQLEVKSKTVTIDADKDNTFYGNSGTRYIIPANSLEKMDGSAVTGDVEITVREFLKKGDMIFSKMLPVSNGQPLISGGELDIKATQNGQALKMKDNMVFTANIPQEHTANPAMQFFIGEPKPEDRQNQVNWVLPDRQTQGKGNGVVVLGTDTLSLFSDSMAMCNADMFMTNPDYKTFTVSVNVTGGTIANDDDVYGYAVYDGHLGMWPMMNFSNGKISENHVPGIPVHFVVFALIGGEFFGGTVSATPENGGNYSVTLTKTDAATFKQQINNM